MRLTDFTYVYKNAQNHSQKNDTMSIERLIFLVIRQPVNCRKVLKIIF